MMPWPLRTPRSGVPATTRAPGPLGRGLAFARGPEGIRTLATAVRGRRPGPLDDGAVHCAGTQVVQEEIALLAGVPGLEPRLTEPETVGLPITPYPKGRAAPRGAGTELYPMAAEGRRAPPGPAGQAPPPPGPRAPPAGPRPPGRPRRRATPRRRTPRRPPG